MIVQRAHVTRLGCDAPCWVLFVLALYAICTVVEDIEYSTSIRSVCSLCALFHIDIFVLLSMRNFVLASSV